MMRPLAVPIANASSVSSSVTPKCRKILPEMNQSTSRCNTTSGSPKKNGDITPIRVNPYQASRSAPSSAACHGHIERGATATTRRSAFGSGMRHHDLLLQRLPDLGMQRDEARVHSNLGNVARPGQIDCKLRHRARSRPGGQHDDAIGERDRFFEVMSDE